MKKENIVIKNPKEAEIIAHLREKNDEKITDKILNVGPLMP